MKNKLSVSLVLSGCLLANTTFAFSFLDHSKMTAHHNKPAGLQAEQPSDGYVDFSGKWVGNCRGKNREDEMTLEIESFPPFGISINGVRYGFDLIENHSEIDKSNYYNESHMLKWSQDKTKLSGRFVDLDRTLDDESSNLGVSLGKVVFSIDADQLKVHETFANFHFKTMKTAVAEDMVCTLKRM